MSATHQNVTLLDASALAAHLGVGREQVYSLVREGLPCYRTSRGARAEYRFDLAEVLAWLRVQPAAQDAHLTEPVPEADLFSERRFVRVRKPR
jgi:phage terminase Nu1 subunit (DNA packaging protein)